MDQYFPKVIYRALFLLFSFLLFLLSIYSHGDVPVNKAGLWESVGIGGSVTHASQAPRLSKRYARVIFGQAFFSPKFHLHNPSLNTPQMHMHTHTHTFNVHTHPLDHVQYKVDGHFRESRTTLNSTIQAGDGRFAFILWLYWTAAGSHGCWNKSCEVWYHAPARWDRIVRNRL